jgi:ClpP class serine protease
LIALAANQIVMSPHAVLGPIDPQLGKYPAASVLKVIARKPIAEIEDETLILADQAEKAIVQLRAEVKQLLEHNLTDGKADDLARLLSEGTWTHDYPITFERAKTLGLRVDSNMPEDIMKLMALFPQPIRQQPSVEYLPGPRTRKPLPAATPAEGR